MCVCEKGTVMAEGTTEAGHAVTHRKGEGKDSSTSHCTQGTGA